MGKVRAISDGKLLMTGAAAKQACDAHDAMVSARMTEVAQRMAAKRAAVDKRKAQRELETGERAKRRAEEAANRSMWPRQRTPVWSGKNGTGYSVIGWRWISDTERRDPSGDCQPMTLSQAKHLGLFSFMEGENDPERPDDPRYGEDLPSVMRYREQSALKRKKKISHAAENLARCGIT